MTLKRFVVPAEKLQDNGLDSINMTGLSKFVVLAGKNGAGKSRILNQLNTHIQGLNVSLNFNLSNLEQDIKNKEFEIARYSNNANQAGHVVNLQMQIDSQLNMKKLVEEREFLKISTQLEVVPFVPKQLQLNDPGGFNKNQLDAYSTQAINPGFNGFENICFSYIQKIQNKWHSTSHQNSKADEAIKKAAKQEYDDLCSLIKLFLGVELDRSNDDDATLFRKPLAQAGLSDGQKIILQFTVASHAQIGKLDNTIFLMDEPENHLHPSALIEFMDAITSVANGSQFWIATHSVPLLAHIAKFEPMSIWYVENGKVSNSGRKPEQVLESLLGNEERINHLRDFISLPAHYASINYATECLFIPKPVNYKKGDDQINQIAGALNFDEAPPTSPIRILDFGAGKSRLLTGLNELAKDNGKNLTEYIDYFAFDICPDDKEDSLKAIESIYGQNSDNRHFSDIDTFFHAGNKSNIDVVVMCNVLHEISPSQWVKDVFHSDGLIRESLNDDSGFLLIVEDQLIPTGEKAHEFGFIVLDTAHLHSLFDIKNPKEHEANGTFCKYDERNDGRLKAHKISKNLLTNVSESTVKKAISELKATAKRKIKEQRGVQNPDGKNGRLHSFWVQQFANASLFIE
ncbi:MAG: AAA family ATPase [Methylococcales bacterium]|nr:AAA family ATPase [Methylococcales bacterium]